MRSVKVFLLMIVAVIMCTVSSSAYSNVQGSYEYSDVQSDYEYYDAVQYVTEQGISNGVGNNRFAPDSKINVAQFSTMLVRIFGSDSDKEIKYCTYDMVSICVKHGWLSNTALYDINCQITRGNAVLAMLKALEIDIYDSELYDGTYMTPVVNAIRIANYNGLYSQSTSATETITRGEAANIIYYFMTHSIKQETPQIVKDFPVVNNNGMSVNNYYIEIMKCPQPIRDKFVSEKWEFIIDSNFVSQYSNSHEIYSISGITSYGDRKMYVVSSDAILHEMGHFLQHVIDSDSKINYLYNIEGKNNIVLRQYARQSSSEYFADYFAYYIDGSSRIKELLKEVSPETYAFFQKLESNGWV